MVNVLVVFCVLMLYTIVYTLILVKNLKYQIDKLLNEIHALHHAVDIQIEGIEKQLKDKETL